jgi:hypothetical protein
MSRTVKILAGALAASVAGELSVITLLPFTIAFNHAGDIARRSCCARAVPLRFVVDSEYSRPGNPVFGLALLWRLSVSVSLASRQFVTLVVLHQQSQV